MPRRLIWVGAWTPLSVLQLIGNGCKVPIHAFIRSGYEDPAAPCGLLSDDWFEILDEGAKPEHLIS